MSFFKSPLQYLGVAATNPPAVVFSPRDPTSADNGYERVTLWLNTTTPSLWSYPGSGSWLQLSGGGGGGDLLAANNLSDVANANTSFKNISPQTTKGDLIAYNASLAPVRVAVGADGTVLTASAAAAGGVAWSANGTGDVVGPVSSTDNALARFDSTTGKLLQNSVAILTDLGALSGLQSVTIAGGTGNVFSINTDLLFVDTTTGYTGLGTVTAVTKLHVVAENNTITNTIAEVARLQAKTTGSSAGYGTAIGFAGTNQIGVARNIGLVAAVYSTVTNGAEASYLKFSSATAGSLAENFRSSTAGLSTDAGVTFYKLADFVAGAASSTDEAICRFDGTTGKVIQNSLVTISDAGTIIAPAISAGSASIDTTVPINNDVLLNTELVARVDPGAPVAGFGVGITLTAENGIHNLANIGVISAVFSDVTNAAEASYVQIKSITGGALGEAVRFTTDGISTNAGTDIFKYVTGTFTPVFVRSGVTYNYTTQLGTYTKIGNVVNFAITIVLSSTSGSGSGDQSITGLPFATKNTTGLVQIYSCRSNNIGFPATLWVAQSQPNTTVIDFGLYDINMASTTFAAQVGTSSTTYITGSYLSV